MSLRNRLAQIIYDVLKGAPYEIQLDQSEIAQLIELPKNRSHGDFAFPCFSLSKILRQNPQSIAQKLSLNISHHLIERTTHMGAYLNFFVSPSELAKFILPSILNGDELKTHTSKKDRVMVEYSQPNTHKAFHVGHIRNVALGDSLVRLLRWSGYPVIAANYIGDEGAHIAKCLWYLKNFNHLQTPTTNRGEFLGEIYVKATQELDFSRWCQIPMIGITLARILNIENHPLSKYLKVVQIDSGFGIKQVVCGGKGFQVGNHVAFAGEGVRVGGREVRSEEKETILSEGVICSKAELGISEDNDVIFIFDSSYDLILGEEISEITRNKGIGPGVAERIIEREKEVEDILKEIEWKKGETYSLWKETRRWSLETFHEIYKWLDVHFDHFFYESEVADLGKKLVTKYHEQNIFKESEGAIGVDLSSKQLPFFLVLKSNGTTLYSTKDLALAEKKFSEFSVDRSIYVVDIRQTLHFQQVFATLELMGFHQVKKCYHLAYGFVEGSHGEMSSRLGNVILFSQLKDKLSKKIKSDFLDKYIGEWSKDEIEEATKKIAIGTIKYGMLNQDAKKNIIFDLDEWTSQTGNTGPYLQYAYARTRSILREVGPVPTVTDWSPLQDETEKYLLVKLSLFTETTLKAAERMDPQIMCIYLYELSKDFSRMYASCSVLKAPDQKTRVARAQLVEATGEVIKKGLELIGIQTLERM